LLLCCSFCPHTNSPQQKDLSLTINNVSSDLFKQILILNGHHHCESRGRDRKREEEGKEEVRREGKHKQKMGTGQQADLEVKLQKRHSPQSIN
jgi:hypothetical protein